MLCPNIKDADGEDITSFSVSLKEQVAQFIDSGV